MWDYNVNHAWQPLIFSKMKISSWVKYIRNESDCFKCPHIDYIAICTFVQSMLCSIFMIRHNKKKTWSLKENLFHLVISCQASYNESNLTKFWQNENFCCLLKLQLSRKWVLWIENESNYDWCNSPFVKFYFGCLSC